MDAARVKCRLAFGALQAREDLGGEVLGGSVVSFVGSIDVARRRVLRRKMPQQVVARQGVCMEPARSDTIRASNPGRGVRRNRSLAMAPKLLTGDCCMAQGDVRPSRPRPVENSM